MLTRIREISAAGPVSMRGLCHRDFLDAHSRDPIAVHLQHGEAPPLVLDGSDRLWDVPQPEEQEPGQGFETCVGRNLYPVFALEVAYARRSVQLHFIGL